MSTPNEPVRNETEPPAPTTTGQQAINLKPSLTDAAVKNQTEESLPLNPCVLCMMEEKRLACIPCGHFTTCVPCGHSLRLCPICRREIEAFVRIYL
jgi:hypothetical protein